MNPMKYVVLLLIVFNFLFAISGIELFKENDPFHFGSLQAASLTIYR